MPMLSKLSSAQLQDADSLKLVDGADQWVDALIGGVWKLVAQA